MKKTSLFFLPLYNLRFILVIVFLMAAASSSYAQLTEFNFNCPLYNDQHCSPFVAATARCMASLNNAEWYATHGSPSLLAASVFTNYVPWNVLKAHESGGVFRGEGMYSPYTFKKGRQYRLEIIVKRTDTNMGGQLRLQAANGLVSAGTSSCIEEPKPLISAKEDILIISRAHSINSIKKNFVSPVFAPKQDFNQLWVFAEEIFLGNNCEHYIEYMTIDDLGPVPVIIPPPDPESPIQGNVICCDQCLPLGTSVPIVQAPGVTLTGANWFRWRRYDSPGGNYVTISNPLADGVSYTPSTNWSNQTYYYRRLTGDTPSVGDVKSWSNYVKYSFYEPVVNVYGLDYRYSGTQAAQIINIICDEESEPIAGDGTINFIAAQQINVKPNSILLPNTHLRIDPYVVPCTENTPPSGGRMATAGTKIINAIDTAGIEALQLKTSEESEFAEGEDGIRVFPNPTSGETTIVYRLDRKSHVKLFLTDNMGRKVADLVSKESLPSDEYVVRFNAKEFTPGLYFCILITDHYRKIKKVSVADK
jgi:hypothetical protein